MSTAEEEERGNKESRKGTERSLQEARLKRKRLKRAIDVGKNSVRKERATQACSCRIKLIRKEKAG